MRRRRWDHLHHLSAAVALAALVLVGGATGGSGAAAPRTATSGALLTYDYDNARSGNDTADPAIGNLSAAPVFDRHLDGGVYAEPLIDGARAYVATEGDSIYALNARNGAIAWGLHLGTPVSQSVVDTTPGVGCGDIDPEGITGTPAIDPANDELFVVGEIEAGGHRSWQYIRHELFAISLQSHRVLWQRDVDPPGANNPGDYYIGAEQQRSAVTISGGRVYSELGGLYGDCGQYHGYVVGIAESGAGALLSYQVPTAREGAIWETGGAMVAPDGDLYVATGNGSSNNPRAFDEGNSVIELTPTLKRVGVWAPSNWVQLNDDDWDLGSAGPIQIPGTSRLFIAGKPAANGSVGYLLDEGHLGGIGGPAYTGSLCSGGGVFGADAVMKTGARILVYAACGSGTTAVRVAGARFVPAWRQSTGDANGPPIIAGGMVWALDWGGGALYGMNPLSGHVELQRPTDSLEHFATPAVGDSRILVPTQSGVEGFRTLA